MDKINIINNSNKHYFKYSKSNSNSYKSDEYLRNDQYFQSKLSILWRSLIESYSNISPFNYTINKEIGYYNNKYLNNRLLVIKSLNKSKASVENLTINSLYDFGYSISLFEYPIPIQDAITIQSLVQYNGSSSLLSSLSSSTSSPIQSITSNEKIHLIRLFGIIEHFFFFINKRYYNQIYFSNYFINNVFFNEKPLFRSIIQYYQIYYKYLNYNQLFLTIFNSEKLNWFLNYSDIGELSYLLDLLFGTISIDSKLKLIKMIHTIKPSTENQKQVIGCIFINYGWVSFNLKEFYMNPLQHDDNLYQDIKENQERRLKLNNNNNKIKKPSLTSSSFILFKSYSNNPDEADKEDEFNNYIRSNDINLVLDDLDNNNSNSNSNNININNSSNNNTNINTNNNNSSSIDSNNSNNNNNIKLNNFLLSKIFNQLINLKYKSFDKDSKESKREFYSSISKSIQSIALSSKDFYNLISNQFINMEWNKYNINLIQSQYSIQNSNNKDSGDSDCNSGSDSNNKCLIKVYPEFQSYNNIIKTINYNNQDQIVELCKSIKTLYIDTLVQIITDNENEYYSGDFVNEGSRLNDGLIETFSASYSTFFKCNSFPNVKKLILKGRSIKRYDFKLNGFFFKFIEYFIINGGSSLEHFEMNGKVIYESSKIIKLVELVLKYHQKSLSSITLRIKHKKRNWVRAIIKRITTYHPNIKLEIYKNNKLESNIINDNNNSSGSKNELLSNLDIYDLVDESDDNSITSGIQEDHLDLSNEYGEGIIQQQIEINSDDYNDIEYYKDYSGDSSYIESNQYNSYGEYSSDEDYNTIEDNEFDQDYETSDIQNIYYNSRYPTESINIGVQDLDSYNEYNEIYIQDCDYSFNEDQNEDESDQDIDEYKEQTIKVIIR